METKPFGTGSGRRIFTRKDYEKGKCDENGLALKPEIVKLKEDEEKSKSEEPKVQEQSPQTEAPTEAKESTDKSSGGDSKENTPPKEKAGDPA